MTIHFSVSSSLLEICTELYNFNFNLYTEMFWSLMANAVVAEVVCWLSSLSSDVRCESGAVGGRYQITRDMVMKSV